MNTLAPSTPGSLYHSWRVGARLALIDIKQGLRKHLAGKTWRDYSLRAGGILFGLTFLASLHLAAFALINYAGVGYLNGASHADSHGLRDLLRGVGTAVWCFLLFVMLSGGLVRALVVLHEQDDSNLLLSAPVSPRAILSARLFGMPCNPVSSTALSSFPGSMYSSLFSTIGNVSGVIRSGLPLP